MQHDKLAPKLVTDDTDAVYGMLASSKFEIVDELSITTNEMEELKTKLEAIEKHLKDRWHSGYLKSKFG